MTNGEDTEGNIVEMHAIMRGRVQGVGFRFAVERMAEQQGLVGTVKNVPDGSVEIRAQGPRNRLDQLVAQLQGPGGPGYVDATDIRFFEADDRFDGFKIVF